MASVFQVAPARLLLDASTSDLILDRMEKDPTCTACVSSIAVADRDEDMATACELEYCSTPCEIEVASQLMGVSVAYQDQQENWLCRFHIKGWVPYNKDDLLGTYWTCLYSAVCMLGGAFLREPVNSLEYFVTTIVNLLGLFLWAIVQGVVCAMMSTGNPLETEYKNNLDAINFLMEDSNLDPELRRRMRAYMRSTKETKKRSGYTNLIASNFSQELQEEIRFNMSGHLLANSVPFLSHVFNNDAFPNNGIFFEKLSGEPFSPLPCHLSSYPPATTSGLPCTCSCLHSPPLLSSSPLTSSPSAHVDRKALAPAEMVDVAETVGIYVITAGVGAKAGEILLKGQSFGQDCIISSPALRDNRAVRCLSYVEVAVIERHEILEVMEEPEFKEIKQHILTTALRLATVRSVMLCSLYREMLQARHNVRAEISKQQRAQLDISMRQLKKVGVVQTEEELPHNISLGEAMKAVHKIIGHKAGPDETFNEWKELSKRRATDADEEEFKVSPVTGVLVNKDDDILVTDSVVLRNADGSAKRDEEGKTTFGEKQRMVYSVEEEGAQEGDNKALSA